MRKERGNKKRNNIFSPRNLLVGFVVIIILVIEAFSDQKSLNNS